MKKLLVTGISGFLGWNILHYKQENWSIAGIHFQNEPNGAVSSSIDLTKKEELRVHLEKFQPDAILHLAAISNVGYCEKNREEAYRINVWVPQYLSAYCQEQEIPFLFTSSEQVFDGNKSSYNEKDKPNPINQYGLLKVEAERLIQKSYPNACIVRISVMYGQHGPSAYCFMTDWLGKLSKGQEITVFDDEIRSFLSGRYAAVALFFLLNQQANGIYHLGGGEGISRTTFAHLLGGIWEIENPKINICSQKDIPGLAEKRPTQLVMDCRKLFAFGGPKPLAIREELVRCKKRDSDFS